jgi:heme O synthase-like polyprenyltransferase
MGFIKGLTEAIYLIAGVIAALMIVIHGIRMVTAQDPSDRNAAKNSIIYVLIALVIIVLAGTLVALLLKPGAIPGT